MVFWVGILLGGFFAWFAVKTGFYETWIMLFNIVISIYLAIFLRPIIVDIVPATGGTPYGNALTMIATAIGVFLILHGISYVFFTSQFSFSFPKIFNTLGAGFLGFLAGFLVWSFVSLLIYITPISQNTFIKDIGFGNQFEQTNMPVICWWCDLLNRVVSRQDNVVTGEQVISGLLKSAGSKAPPQTSEQAEPNEPAEPNDVETDIIEEYEPGRMGLTPPVKVPKVN